MTKNAAPSKLIFKILAFILLLSVAFVACSNVLKLKMGHRGTDNVRGFYALPKESADVLFIGASTAFCTADPLVIYEESGITSYDFTSSAQPFELSLLFIEEALKTQHPRVIALEILSLYNELDINKADSLSFGMTDMPMSVTKLKALRDMFREDIKKALPYAISIIQYKDRWKELTKEDFMPWKDPLTMGAYTPDTISENPLDFSDYYLESDEREIPERNLEIFRRIVEICRSEGIELLVFKSPNVGWTLGQTRGVESLCQDYGLSFIDFYSLMEELKIDPAVDFRDNTHLNRTGSIKTSRYLTKYLQTHYELPDNRGSSRGVAWDYALEHHE